MQPVRDLIGYGRTPPDARWPGGARLAVNFVLNVEEGSERAVGDGDDFGEMGPGFPSPVARGKRDLAAESMFEYGSRVGFWRILDLFAGRSVPLTFFACAQAIERNPKIAEAIRHSGGDVVCHGWRWAQHFDMTEDEERADIARAVQSLTRTLGAPPLGWYCRYGASVNTRRLLVEHGGFLFDSDAYNDDLPYWTTVNHAPHLVVPYSLVTNDGVFARGDVATSGQFFEYLADSFDTLYAEGHHLPRMMSVGLHARIVGHPGRIAGLARFLDHVAAHDDVWVCGRTDIARHWHAHHAPPAAA